MPKDNQFLEYIKELLEPFGNITTRAMFGGYGIYNNGLIIAIIIEDELYFKGEKEDHDFFKSYNSEKFGYYNKNGKFVQMSYWKAPQEVIEDENLLEQWLQRSTEIAYKAK